MVYRWECRHCEFTAWAADRTAAVDAVESHLLDHHAGRLSNEGFGVRWQCPYCGADRQNHDRDEAVTTFADHLFGHAEPAVTGGVHVADAVGGSGSVLVRAPVDGAAANNARSHFLAAGGEALLVTANPESRLRHLRAELGSWPSPTTVLTTAADPLADVDGLDLSAPVEAVTLDRSDGLRGVGRTVSRVLSDRDPTNGRLSVEFDVLPEIVAKFDLQAVFEFLHLLCSRFEKADALSHFYVDPRTESGATLNVLCNVFDLTIAAEGNAFVSEPPGDG